MSHSRSYLRALLAVVATVAVFAVVACGSSTSEQTATPTPDEQTIEEFLAEVDRRMIEIRGIEEPPPVPYRFVDREELKAFIDVQVDDAELIEEIRITESLYKILGLISPETDLYEEYLALLNSQVLGAYDSEAEEFVVLQPGDEFGPLEEFTYAHEFVHRLQDHQFDLEAVSDMAENNDDRSIAITALIEGDATSAQTVYSLRYMDLQALAQLVAESGETIELANNAPYILRRQLEFPYLEGAQFVDRVNALGGYSAVDAAFANPPDSSEQVLHPDKFIEREIPDAVIIPDGIFGEGWTTLDDNVAGEFFLKSWLIGIGASAQNATAAAAGWGGDSYILQENSSRDRAFALTIEWDDPARDPSEFFTVLSAALDSSPDFAVAEVGATAGILVFDGPEGYLVMGNLAISGGGSRTVITAASDVTLALTALLANLA